MKAFRQSLLAMLVLTVLTGALYPALVWGIGEVCFKRQAEGSLVYANGKLVGSELLSQQTTDSKYFWPRPSGGAYATVASGATNLAWTSAKLQKSITDADAAFRKDNPMPATTAVPDDMLTSSGSGLDPDISEDAAYLQVERVAAARHLDSDAKNRLRALVGQHVAAGALSPHRVNVLLLNLAVDGSFGKS